MQQTTPSAKAAGLLQGGATISKSYTIMALQLWVKCANNLLAQKRINPGKYTTDQSSASLLFRFQLCESQARSSESMKFMLFGGPYHGSFFGSFQV
mmetsp:Transcript_53792/g.123378  ORF Transcript_53792/g.123378 Transcript_53792/m.123378 type:complete len:96 (-) Transcript_53792:893-1180(-)